MRSKFGISILVLIGVGGCSPDPELVFIDRSRFAVVDLGAALRSDTLSAAPIPGGTYTVPPLAGKTLYIASVRERFDDAMQEVQRDQEALMAQMFEALRKLYLAELDTLETRERDAILARAGAELDEAYAALRAIFERYADPIGKKWVRLAFLVGFPDPDPNSRRGPRTDDKEKVAVFEEAKRLRGEIKQLGEDYRKEVSAKILTISSSHERELAALAAQYELRRVERTAEAQAEAKEIALRAISQLQGFVLDPSQVLPAEPGSAIQVPAATVRLNRLNPSPAETAFGHKERLDDQIKIFLDTKRYTLSATPAKARNVTEEFAQWRKQYAVGR